ncbi:uncharacterized protein LOC111665288 [Seriola lalandi dorsalis]|uniref:uncharacterized protein LOC111665288 n=1 Tax=Seriola lalandi dorsalis TaxID=1841481 RepID=UPI000C6F83C1|nr:uncharacterized protein LOC111665288 [Seriola lalandi dorsalis]XP_056226437.1 uncharacterized protein LOC130165306 [Seriola aureovittata]
MTSMDGWTLFFVLLLPLTVCFDSEVTLEKTLGSKPDVTPLCNNTTAITLIVCSIKTERSGGEQCRLLYRYGEGFHSSCDSRFTLKNGSETALLHLTSLTPEDSGNYSCQCSYHGGTYIVHLNITVEEEEEVSSPTGRLIPTALTAVTVVLIITGVILGFIHRRIHHGRTQLGPQSSHPNQELQDIEPYGTFMRKESGLYSTFNVPSPNINTNNSNMSIREDTNSGNFL